MKYSPHLSYRPDIDGLRALAILAVVVFHYFPKLMPGGFTGVDIFFVISGFLITRIIVNDLRSDDFSIVRFYFRRVCRILPALIVVLGCGLIAGWFYLMPEEYAIFGKHVLKSVFFVQNINLQQEVGYFDRSSDLKPLLHIWSLSVEEQFYLLWPLLFQAFGRLRKSIVGIVVSLLLISFLINVKYVGSDFSRAFYGLDCRFWELGFGGLIGMGVVPKPQKKLAHPLSVAALVTLLLSFSLMNDAIAFPGWWALVPILATGVLLQTETSLVNKMFSRAAFVYIGKISYPLYLWHWIVISFIRNNSPEVAGTMFARFTCLILSVSLAWVTYILIEKPIRKYRDLNTRKIGFGLIALLLFTGVIGFFVSEQNGFPSRSIQVAANDDVVIDERFDCSKELGLSEIEWCRSSTAAIGNDVVVVGDSHGDSLFSGVVSYYKKQNRSAMFMGIGETLGLHGVSLQGAHGKHWTATNRSLAKAFEWILKNKPKTVILASGGPFYIEGESLGGEVRKYVLVDDVTGIKGSNREIYSKALDRTIEKLTHAGIEVVFIYDNFELGFMPQEVCYARPLAMFKFDVLDPCAVKVEEVQRRYSTYERTVTEVLQRHPTVKTFKLNDYLCDKKLCYGIKDGKVLMKDDHHISNGAALWMSEKFNF